MIFKMLKHNIRIACIILPGNYTFPECYVVFFEIEIETFGFICNEEMTRIPRI